MRARSPDWPFAFLLWRPSGQVRSEGPASVPEDVAFATKPQWELRATGKPVAASDLEALCR